MSTPPDTLSKLETLNIRIHPDERNLIERAAAAVGKDSGDFIRAALQRAAEETLLDRAQIIATPEAYAELLARLDMPPAPNERLLKTMRTRAPGHPSR